jgi:hypothetical protein
MDTRLYRSIGEPVRDGLDWNDRWMGPDQGLIWCWERGRQMVAEEPDLAKAANEGELPLMPWKGGVEEKLKIERKAGTLQYLATWQGLRGEDLDIDREGERAIVCSRTGQTVVFSRKGAQEE